MERHEATPIRLSRRTALRASAAAGATALLATTMPAPQITQAAGANQIEPNAGTWKTWLLSSGSQTALPPPPGDAATKDEIASCRRWSRSATPRRSTASPTGTTARRLSLERDRTGCGGPSNGVARRQPRRGAAQRCDLRRHRRGLGLQVHLQPPAAERRRPQLDDRRPPRPGAARPTPPSTRSRPARRRPSWATSSPRTPRPSRQGDGGGAVAPPRRGAASAATPYAGLALGRRSPRSSSPARRPTARTRRGTGTVPVGPGMWTGRSRLPRLWGRGRPGCSPRAASSAPGPPPAPGTPPSAPPNSPRSRTTSATPIRGTELGFWPEDPAGRPAPDSVPLSSNQARLLLRAVPESAMDLPNSTRSWPSTASTPTRRARRAPTPWSSIALYDAYGRRLGRQVLLLDGAPDPVRPDDHDGAADLPHPGLPLGSRDRDGGDGGGAGLPLPARRALLPVAGGGERGVAAVGGDPLPQRVRRGDSARWEGRAGGD